MQDDRFIAKLNRVLEEQGGELPALGPAATLDSQAIAFWARFLQGCVRSGIQLSDPRWQQLTIVRRGKRTELAMDPIEKTEPDDEFKVGLQLLMGMLGGQSDD